MEVKPNMVIMCKVRNHLEDRMRTHLWKRHNIRDRKTGYYKYPQSLLYERYGLYKVLTTAGWTKTNALR